MRPAVGAAALLCCRGAQASPAASDIVPRDEIVALVRASPAAALARDKQGWLRLFAPGATVEDPVGTWEAAGTADLSKFWDAFIAPSVVNFTAVYQPDLVANASRCRRADCRAVVGRSVEITTTLETGAVVKVHPTLLYTVDTADGALAIRSLRTYWPLALQVTQLLGAGVKGFESMTEMGVSLAVHLGLVNTVTYFKGLVSGIFADGEAAVRSLCAAVNASDEDAFLRATGSAMVQWPAGNPLSPTEAWGMISLSTLRLRGEVHSAGFFSAAALSIDGPGSSDAAVVRLGFDPASKALATVEFFWDS